MGINVCKIFYSTACLQKFYKVYQEIHDFSPYLAPMSPNSKRTYIAIDLKSFYASVECVERGLDPLDTNLVVADESKTERTICLAVSPSLKAWGISGRARLFEVNQRLHEVNRKRTQYYGNQGDTTSSVYDHELKEHSHWKVDFIIAPPRMAHYIEASTRIFNIYLDYIAPEDIHPYSIDEVFIDATDYLPMYGLTAHELAMKMIQDVLRKTGITATAGIGTNLYLCKVAMDIVAKHIPADKDGVRIAELDKMSYRRKLWGHQPLTDFWRVGKGIAQRLEPYGIKTMGQIARLSEQNEEILYKLFGVNAELLIDHAWGWEPCTIDKIKAYRPETNSVCSGQVLTEAYTVEMARNVVLEMADNLSLDLLSKGLVTDQLVMDVGYDTATLQTSAMAHWKGEIKYDHYGRAVPKHAHGTINLGGHTSLSDILDKAAVELYDRIIQPGFLVRRLSITANHVVNESGGGQANFTGAFPSKETFIQGDLFADPEEVERKLKEKKDQEEKARKVQETILSIKNKFGKNAILKGMNFEEGATTIERNQQIGGHKA